MKLKNLLIVSGILAVINMLSWIAVFELHHPYLEVNFFDVGQGDSIFIETPGNQQVLVDGGPDNTVLEKLGQVMPFWDRSLDLVILTHQDRDHIAGLIPVLRNYRVENVIWSGAQKDSAEFKEWEKALSKEGARVLYASAGQKVVFKGGHFEILFPFESFEGIFEKNSNKASIVARLVFGQNSFLLAADIPNAEEKEILKAYPDLSSDFYKVSHHGSEYSNLPDFIREIHPLASIISVGENSYGLPNDEVLEILWDYGIKVLRTDYDGDVKFVLDGNDFRIINN